MDLATALTELGNEVYAASILIERMENVGRIKGNGHHIRQAMAEKAQCVLMDRWHKEREVADYCASHANTDLVRVYTMLKGGK